MTIDHQIVTDAEGNPVAAQISWEQFRVIKAELEVDEDAPLSPEWKAELDRRMESIKNGTAKWLTHEEMMERVEDRLAQYQDKRQSA